jgi:hypothetical protein
MKRSKQTPISYELPIKLAIFCALVAAAVVAAGMTVSAQTASSTSTTSSAGVLSNTTPTASATKKPTTATPDMVNEAIQRSQARAAREQQIGRPQQWGSEEPFVYDPAQKNFTAAHQ